MNDGDRSRDATVPASLLQGSEPADLGEVDRARYRIEAEHARGGLGRDGW